MLSKEANDELTQVGPGKPMGELLRCYWYPVCLTRELDEFPIKKVKLLGEYFAVYKTPAGKYGISAERCPHRGASMVYGMVEEEGIRCGYHGWLFDRDGNCLEQPAEPEDSKFRDKVCLKSGVAEEMGGLVWAYVGKKPAPELPRYSGYVMNGIRDVGHCTIPCNWLQIMENSVDPYHVEWLHNRYFVWLAAKQGGFDVPSAFKRVEHVKVAFDPFEHGIIKRRVLKGQTEEDDDWKIGHPLVFPYCMWVGGNGIYQMQIRVPRDDDETWVAFYSCHAPDGIAHDSSGRIVDYEIPWVDERGTYITDYIEGQDIMAWVTQGRVADRTNEHLGKSDGGVIAMRKMFRDGMTAVREGRDPVAVMRHKHDLIDLPLEKSKFGAGAEFCLQWLERGSMRYSPWNAELRQLHIDAAAARGEKLAV
ncbi:MAG: aromatic ring-hydroxylating dioxygenase subunit alpha [Myxococcota bacterium]